MKNLINDRAEDIRKQSNKKETTKKKKIEVVFPTKELGFVNVRTSPKVDDGQVLPLIGRVSSNLLTKVEGSNTPIGTIISTAKDNSTDPPETWYKLRLDPILAKKTDYRNGYVHSDYVDVKKV